MKIELNQRQIELSNVGGAEVAAFGWRVKFKLWYRADSQDATQEPLVLV